MKLQATGNDGREQRVGRGRGQDEGGGARGFFEDFQEYVGDVPAHGFRAIENKNSPSSDWLEVRSSLNGAKLANA